jgi:hypothetical protein
MGSLPMKCAIWTYLGSRYRLRLLNVILFIRPIFTESLKRSLVAILFGWISLVSSSLLVAGPAQGRLSGFGIVALPLLWSCHCIQDSGRCYVLRTNT